MRSETPKPVHAVKMTETGDVRRVIAGDPNATDQVALIPEHLQHEVRMFRQANDSDPGKLRGAPMVGVRGLETRGAEIRDGAAEWHVSFPHVSC